LAKGIPLAPSRAAFVDPRDRRSRQAGWAMLLLDLVWLPSHQTDARGTDSDTDPRMRVGSCRPGLHCPEAMAGLRIYMPNNCVLPA
jgi:hypothetical protein